MRWNREEPSYASTIGYRETMPSVVLSAEERWAVDWDKRIIATHHTSRYLDTPQFYQSSIAPQVQIARP